MPRCERCNAELSNEEIASRCCRTCGEEFASDRDTWIPPTDAAQPAELVSREPQPNASADATIPDLPPAAPEGSNEPPPLDDSAFDDPGLQTVQVAKCPSCDGNLSDGDILSARCPSCDTPLQSERDTWGPADSTGSEGEEVPSDDNGGAGGATVQLPVSVESVAPQEPSQGGSGDDDIQQTILIPPSPVIPERPAERPESVCPSCALALSAEDVQSGRCPHCGHLLLSDHDTWVSDESEAPPEDDESQKTLIIPSPPEAGVEPPEPSRATCSFCDAALSAEALQSGTCPACGKLLLSEADTWVAPGGVGPPPVSSSSARCVSCHALLSNNEVRSGKCASCGHLLLGEVDTWVAEGARADKEAAEGDEEARGTVFLDKTGRVAAGLEAGERGEDDAGQTIMVPEQDEDGGGKTAMVDELTGDVLKTMKVAWDQAFESDAAPGMTIHSDGGRVAPARESLVIKRRSVRTAAEYDPTNDEYELIDKLGEGGMGVVYQARQTSINRAVALKMLKPGISEDEEQRQKFLTEAVVTGDLDHPNIVPIYDVASNERGALFYAMKKVQGTPWLDVINKKSLHENVEILMRVADAVAFAHDRGVVHRDLKPDNVMLGGYGEILVMDWGLAQPTGRFQKGASITETNSMGGTPAYMAPEMATGPIDRIGPRSDIYLLGAILYEVVTGKPPHTGKSALKCLMAAAKNKIRPTEESGELIDIAMHSMATVPEDRYATVQEFQGAVREYLSHTESIAMSVRAGEDLTKAEESDEYDEYAKALFGYQEAYELWKKNQSARQGVSLARLAYASSAHRKGDYDLAASLLDRADAEHSDLLAQIKAAQEERDARQQRLRTYKRAGIVFAVVFVVVVSGLSIWADLERAEAVRQEGIANTERAEAVKQEGIAKKQRGIAVEQKNEADRQRVIAVANEQKAIEAKEREEYEAYIARIGLAAAKIDENAFDTARGLLKQCEPGPNEKDLRHWEWGRLMHLCSQSLRSFPAAAKVNDVDVGPQGKRFVRSGEDGLAEIVDVTSGKVLLALPHDGHNVHSVAFSRDGRFVATGTDDPKGYAKLWDAQSGELVRSYAGHTDAVLSLRFSADGTRLLTASRDKSARLWDVPTGRQVREFLGHNWWVWSAAFSPDEKRIVTAGQDGIAIVWSVETGQIWTGDAGTPSRKGQTGGKGFRAFTGHGSPVYAAAFSPSGDLVATCGYDRRVLLWKPEELEPYNYHNINTGTPIAPEAEYRALEGHTASVRSVQFSKDGKLIVSSGHDNTIKVWNVETGKALTTFRGHDSWVRAATFGPETRWLLSASHDASVKQWSIENYEEIRVLQGRDLEGHTNAVLAAAFSPDGSSVVTASQDRTAKTWNFQSGSEELTLREGHEFLTSASVFFPDGQTLLTAAVDNTVRFWNAATGTEFRRLDKTGRSAALALSHNAQWIATGGDKGSDETVWKAQLWNADTGERVRDFEAKRSEITAVAFSSDDRFLLAGDALGRCFLWDRETGELIRRFDGHNGKIVTAVFLPGGQRLLTASNDNTVAQWDVETGQERTDLVLKHPDAVVSLSVTHDGRLAATGCSDRRVRVWDVQTAKVVATFTPSGGRATFAANVRRQMGRRKTKWTTADLAKLAGLPEPEVTDILRAAKNATSLAVQKLAEALEVEADSLSRPAISGVAISPDGAQVLAVNPTDRRIQMWNMDRAGEQAAAAEGREEPFLEFQVAGGLVWSAAFSRDGAFVVTVGGSDARMWDAKTGQERMRFSPHGVVAAARFSPDAQRIVTAGWDNSARIWDVQTGMALLKLEGPQGHTGQVNSAVFSPDAQGQGILTASEDHTAKLWDSKTGKMIRTFQGHSAGVRQAIFSADGQQVLTASDDTTARIWETSTGKELYRLTGHELPVLCVAFFDNGTQVVTGSEDSTAIIWNAQTGERILTLVGHTADVTSVACSPDGRRVLTGSADYIVKLWDARKPEESDQAKEILSLTGHTREITSVAFSRDGRYTLTGSRDGKAILWLTAPWETTEQRAH